MILFNEKVIDLSVSSVVQKNVTNWALIINRSRQILSIQLNQDSWNVLIIANGARINSQEAKGITTFPSAMQFMPV